MTGDERNPANAQEELTPEQEFQAFLDQEKDEEGQEAEPETPETSEAQTPAQPTLEPKPDAWLEEVPETVRERVRQELTQREQAAAQAKADAQKFENQWRAQRGQLAPTQTKLAELERQLQAAKQTPAKQAGMTEDAWAKYQRDFPEESAAFKAGLNPLQEQVQTMAQRLAEIEQEREVARTQAEVRAAHPDIDELKQRPEFDPWIEDFAERDPFAADLLAKADSGEKLKPREIAWLVSKFKEDAANADLYAELETLRARVSGQPAAPAADPKAQAALGRREQQKRDPAVGIKTGQSAPMGRRNATGGYPGEDEFAAFLAQNPP